MMRDICVMSLIFPMFASDWCSTNDASQASRQNSSHSQHSQLYPRSLYTIGNWIFNWELYWYFHHFTVVMMSNNRKMGPESDNTLVGKLSKGKNNFDILNFFLSSDFCPVPGIRRLGKLFSNSQLLLSVRRISIS